MDKSLLQQLQAARADKLPVVWLRNLADNSESLWFPGQEDPHGAAAVLARGKAARQEQMFLQPFLPPKRLLIVGAVHIAQALIPLAEALDFSVILIDPRGFFASEERFPGVEIDRRWPDEAIPALKPDAMTCLVALSHDPKLDDPALETALRSEPGFAYIGALGSRRTHAGRMERLTEAGLSAEAIANIHAPIGLDIKAVSPAEIAVSILAEIIQTLHQKG